MKLKKLTAALLIGAALVFSQSAPAEAVFNNRSVSVYAPQNERQVFLGGQTVGVAIYTKGLLITDISPVEDENGHFIIPAAAAGIKKGDFIISANGIRTDDVSNMDAILSASNGEKISMGILRGEKELSTEITPVKCANDKKYRLGLWMRDSAAGLGTVTYIEPKTGAYTALGHSICDSDTDEILSVRTGRIVECTVTGVTLSQKGRAGELKGTFGVNAKIFGTVESNTKFGIKGIAGDELKRGELIALGSRDDVHEGKAKIYSDFDTGAIKSYEIEITHVNQQTYPTEKSMVIRITDPELLQKTGGIVQGMSGSPIVQDGKLIGAVTHVMISDSSRGYGIFIENMIGAAENAANENKLKDAA